MIKDGKLFGKINLFDAAILFLILILIVAGILKFKTFNKTANGDASLGKITYTMIINNVRDYTADSFVSGDAVYDSGTNIQIGNITNIATRDARIIKSLVDGRTEIVENPYRKDIILTVETPGTSTENGYYANKSIELKIGSEKKIKTLYSVTTAEISSLIYEE